MAFPGGDATLPNMTPERWRQVKAIFERAVEVPDPAIRAQFVEAAAGGDRVILREVLSLLDAHADSSELLSDTPAAGQAIAPAVLECSRCGLCIEQSAGATLLRTCPDDGSPLVKAFDGTAVVDGKYLVEKRLGRGGMGAVYQVRHLGLARRFALKLIAPLAHHPGLSVELFEREAKALGRLKHPNILDVTDYGVDPRGLPYLVTELLEGRTLHAACTNAMPLAEAAPILQQIARAIDYVHAQGLLHRDLKLSNVFLAGTVRLMDFGLAAADDRSRSTMGTPDYMAPELLSGSPASRASDIYALGVIAHVMLKGELPGETQTGWAMLAKDPAARPSTATAAVEVLLRREWRRRETPRRLAFAALLACIGALLAIGLQHLQPIDLLELRTIDLRFAARTPTPPNPSIVLVVLDEASLTETPLAARAGEFGTVLDSIFRAGARGVALDFLFPESWSRSRPFIDLVLHHADRLTLGLYSDPSGHTVGAECVAGLVGAALGPERLDHLFAFINLDQDSDGVIRRARTAYSDRSGAQRPTWPAAAVAKSGIAARPPAERFWLDYSVRSAGFPRISWKDAAARSHDFHDKLVLVGADYLASEDTHRVPVGSGRLAGIGVQAIAVHTILAGQPVRDVPYLVWLSLFALFAAGLCSMILLDFAWAPIAAAIPVAWVLIARFDRNVLPVVAPILAFALLLAGTLLLRKRLSRLPQ